MRHLIPCKTPGCENFAREHGQKQDCPHCAKELCEECCDKQRSTKIEKIKVEDTEANQRQLLALHLMHPTEVRNPTETPVDASFLLYPAPIKKIDEETRRVDLPEPRTEASLTVDDVLEVLEANDGMCLDNPAARKFIAQEVASRILGCEVRKMMTEEEISYLVDECNIDRDRLEKE